jgi:hypothetical protein
VQISDYLEDLATNHLLRAVAHTPTSNVYLALFSDATTDAGGGTEAVGGSYARQAITVGAPSSGQALNTNAMTFPNMPAGTWTHAAIMDASSAGNMLFHGPLPTPKTTIAGQSIGVSVGELEVGFSAGSAATEYLRDLIIDRFLRNQAHTPAATIYLALYADTTTISGGGTEVTGGSYARQPITLAAASGGVTSNTAQIDFTDLPDQTADPITHAAIHNHVSAGNMMLQGALGSSVPAAAGDTARLAVGDLQHTLR